VPPVLGPPVGRPLVFALHNVDKPCGLELGYVLDGRVDRWPVARPCLAHEFDPLKELAVRRHCVVVGFDEPRYVLDLDDAARTEGSATAPRGYVPPKTEVEL